MQHRGGRIERYRRAGLHPGVVPAFALGPPHGHHVVGEDPAESRIGQQRSPLGG
jgi:hypothetical protein